MPDGAARTVSNGMLAAITGGGSGTARGTAVRLSGDGFPICGIDVESDTLRATGELLPDGASVTEVPDLANVAIEETFTRIPNSEGAVDALDDNAGTGFAETSHETSVATGNLTVAVDLSAMFHTCHAILPSIIALAAATVLNASSVAGVLGAEQRAAYCAAKAGLTGLACDCGGSFRAGNPGQRDRSRHGPHRIVRKFLGDLAYPDELPAKVEARQLGGATGSPEEIASRDRLPGPRFVNDSASVTDGGMTPV